jgi:hypothetical protein
LGARGRVEPSPPPIARQDSAPRPAVRTAPQAEPVGAERTAPVERKPVRESAPRGRETVRSGALPAANVPWTGDDVEGEIVRALRVEPSPPLAPRQADGGRAKTEAAITLGDLAERLEEALAREVRAAGRQAEAVEPDMEPFDFQTDELEPEPPPAPEPRPAEPRPRIAEQRERSEPRERPQADARDRVQPKDRTERRDRDVRDRPEPRERLEQRRPAERAEPDRREARASVERQDEAPVISLSSRRREPVDPLEDEMARLLGELTGDQNRR